jgi:uncharacterized membrane protein YccC
VIRHAVRAAVLVAASDLVVRLADLSRGYWVSLTVLVVLRPDFGATLQRAVMRTLGTIIGLLLASELVRWVPGGDWWHVALIAIFAFTMRLAGPANVAPSAISLSALVVVLLEINGVPAHATLVDRSLATLAGGALAVAAAVALPAWERQYVPARLAALLAAYRAYLLTVADPASDRADLQRARAACRVARTNAQASVERARAEPVRGEAEVELGRTVLAHSHRFIHAVLALDAVRSSLAEAGGGPPELRAFLATAAEALQAEEAALRAGTAPRSMPKLRPRYEALAEKLNADADSAGGLSAAATVADATDRITNSLDTLAVELRRQLRPADKPDAPRVSVLG